VASPLWSITANIFIFLASTTAASRVTVSATDQGATLVTTPTAVGRMMIGGLGSLAEYERELVRERTALKRAASRANGTKFGRHRKVDDADTSPPRSA
jgi:DNA invertase Pin-like site-specific DNA recombinase